MKITKRIQAGECMGKWYGYCWTDYPDRTLVAVIPLNVFMRFGYATWLFFKRPVASFDVLFRSRKPLAELAETQRELYETKWRLDLACMTNEELGRNYAAMQREIDKLRETNQRLDDMLTDMEDRFDGR